MRRIARENVFKLVFEYTFYGVVNDATLELMLVDSDLTEDDKNYINSTYFGVVTNEEELKRSSQTTSKVIVSKECIDPITQCCCLQRMN